MIITNEEKIGTAIKMLEKFKSDWYDLDFTIRFNNQAKILNPDLSSDIDILNRQLIHEKTHKEKMIDFLENDIKQLRCQPISQLIDHGNEK
ncbi:MAG: hypothetical protein WC737_05595 [Parcubacteria group bacterium]|jgi:hypothetical protein